KLIDGGDDSDTLNLLGDDSREINLTDGISSVDVINALDGTGVYTLIAGNDRDNTWTVNGTTDNFNSTIAFSGIDSLVGGSKVDTFNISSTIDTLTGGIGADIFNITAETASITAGTGEDIINLGNGGFVTKLIDGGDDSDTLNLLGDDSREINLTDGISSVDVINALDGTGVYTLIA
ncbi:MAG: hypothetical protein GY830_10005, partial [Bacteroidetes bacterium]|nr:hypothetical protein [Bacteroidota bacterium]